MLGSLELYLATSRDKNEAGLMKISQEGLQKILHSCISCSSASWYSSPSLRHHGWVRMRISFIWSCLALVAMGTEWLTYFSRSSSVTSVNLGASEIISISNRGKFAFESQRVVLPSMSLQSTSIWASRASRCWCLRLVLLDIMAEWRSICCTRSCSSRFASGVSAWI